MTYSKHLEADQKGPVEIGSGSAKPCKPDDPMQLKGDLVAGDQRVMLECLIEEFARMGWNGRQIARLFEKPFFLASHSLAKRFGRQAVHECIEQTLERCGVFRVEMSETKPNPEPIRRSQFITISACGDDSPYAKKKGDVTLKGDPNHG
ncbi:MAG: hypothetical protein V3V79_01725 [Gammaproteobacteria bacterium]|jgi:hypothetical protein